MTLQSQSPRIVGSRSSSGSSSRRDVLTRRVVPIVGVALAVALVAVVWSTMVGRSDEGPAVQDLATAPSATTAPATATTTTATATATGASTGSTLALAPAASVAPTPVLPTPSTPAAPSAPSASPAPSAAPAPMDPTGLPAEVRDALNDAQRAIASGELVKARTLLNGALFNNRLGARDRAGLREQIAQLNERLFFSPKVYPGDALSDVYAIASGDSLFRLPRKLSLPIEPTLLSRVNAIADPSRLQVGQKVKVIRQPLHAIVHKNDFRMDIWAGPPLPAGTTSFSSSGPDGQSAGWTFVRSFRVGLGESNGTPTGMFVVKTNSKLVNPEWVNPRTRERFAADNPDNPIGERWIGLEGVDERTKPFVGYGIHGTTEPDSIGAQRSMGCVRMLPGDVEIVYDLLVPRLSSVRIID